MIQFIVGVISSIAATAIIYFFRFQIGFVISILFYKVYPNITGEYTVFKYKFTDKKYVDLDVIKQKEILPPSATNKELLDYLKIRLPKNNKTFFKIKFKQFANRITGEYYVIQNGSTKSLEKISGRITTSRVLILNSETKDEQHHNFGTYLLTITNNTTIIKGIHNSLCINCGDALAEHIILEKG